MQAFSIAPDSAFTVYDGSPAEMEDLASLETWFSSGEDGIQAVLQ
jgi:hypothetical protein